MWLLCADDDDTWEERRDGAGRSSLEGCGLEEERMGWARDGLTVGAARRCVHVCIVCGRGKEMCAFLKCRYTIWPNLRENFFQRATEGATAILLRRAGAALANVAAALLYRPLPKIAFAALGIFLLPSIEETQAEHGSVTKESRQRRE